MVENGNIDAEKEGMKEMVTGLWTKTEWGENGKRDVDEDDEKWMKWVIKSTGLVQIFVRGEMTKDVYENVHDTDGIENEKWDA